MINNNLAVNPNIQRFEQTYTQQSAKDKTTILGMRIGGGVALGGSGTVFVAAIALTVALVAGAVAVSLVALPLIMFTVSVALGGAAIMMLTGASIVKDNRNLTFLYRLDNLLFFPAVPAMTLDTLDKSMIQNLNKYGFITEKTGLQLIAFNDRYTEAKGKKVPNYELLEDLRDEFVNGLRPQIWSELPLKDETLTALKDFHERFAALPPAQNSKLIDEFVKNLMPQFRKDLVRIP